MSATLEQALIDLDPARLGEINLLLSALADHEKSRDVARKWVLSISGRSDRIPQPDLYFKVALGLGLIQESGGNLALTKLGEEFQAFSSGPPYDQLKPEQVHLLAPELLLHPELQESVIQAWESMYPSSSDRLQIALGDTSITPPVTLGLKLLQMAGFARYDKGMLVITDDGLRDLRVLLRETAPVSEDGWLQIQQGVNKRARDDEEYVLQFERERLAHAGYRELSGMVIRVSEYDMAAHYDIHSFEENARPRYIEVKSSLSLHLNYIWTLGERKFARTKGTAYWIYFVPRAQDLPKLRHGLILIRDPESKCGDILYTEPFSFRVTLHIDTGDIPKVKMGEDTVSIIE